MATDNFNSYSAGALAGNGNWVAANGAFRIFDSGGGDMVVQSNTAGDNTLQYYSGTVNDDQYSQGVIESEDSGNSIGVGVRISGSGATVKGYGIEIVGGNYYIYKVTNGTGTWSQLGTGSTSGWSYPATIRIEAEGTTIRAYKDGVQLGSDITDSSLASGNPGVVGYNSTAATTGVANDWDGGNLVFATIEQEGFRWRNDDGSETTATWADAQDTDISAPVGENRRLRTLLNATGDPGSTQFQLEYRLSGGTYAKVLTADPPQTRTEITADSSTANASTYDTASVALTAGRLYVMGVLHSDAAAETDPTGVATVGGAVTFAKLDSQVFNTLASNVHVLSVWWVKPVSTVTAAIRVSLNDAGTGCAWNVQEYAYPHGTTELGTPVKNGVNASTSISVTPGALADTDSHQIAFGALDLNNTGDTASGTNWASVGTGNAYGSPATGLECAENTSGTASQVTFSGAGSADRAVIAVEVRFAPVPQPILLATSANITAGGEATTAQLTAPSGKTTADFTVGRMQDDENPADAVDISADDYTEMEWCLTAVSGVASVSDVYQFRVTKDGTALDTYTVTPEWTISTAGASETLTPLVIGFQAQGLSSGAATAELDPIAIGFQAQSLPATPAVTLSPVAVGITVGEQLGTALTLPAISIGLQAQSLSSGTDASVTLDPLTIALSPEALAAHIEAAVGPLTVAFDAQTLSPAVAAPLSTVSIGLEALSVSPAVAMLLDVLGIAIDAGTNLGIAIELDALALGFDLQSFTAGTGASQTLDPLAIGLSQESLTAAVSDALDALVIGLDPLALSAAVTAALDAVALGLSAEALTGVEGITFVLDPIALAFEPQSIAPAVGNRLAAVSLGLEPQAFSLAVGNTVALDPVALGFAVQSLSSGVPIPPYEVTLTITDRTPVLTITQRTPLLAIEDA